MKKKLMTLLLTACTSVAIAFTSFAGYWRKDDVGYWYQNDDGSYPVNCWQWIDDNDDGVAECFYFDENGYVLMNAISPDGYTINPEGEWVVDGVVQTKAVYTASSTQTATSAPDTSTNKSVQPTAQVPQTSAVQTTQAAMDVSDTVYIPATGKKYHSKPNCGNMNPAKASEVTLQQAVSRGYTRCSKCY